MYFLNAVRNQVDSPCSFFKCLFSNLSARTKSNNFKENFHGSLASTIASLSNLEKLEAVKRYDF